MRFGFFGGGSVWLFSVKVVIRSGKLRIDVLFSVFEAIFSVTGEAVVAEVFLFSVTII